MSVSEEMKIQVKKRGNTGFDGGNGFIGADTTWLTAWDRIPETRRTITEQGTQPHLKKKAEDEEKWRQPTDVQCE